MSDPHAMGADALYVTLKDEIRRISTRAEFAWFLAVQDGISNFDAHYVAVPKFTNEAGTVEDLAKRYKDFLCEIMEIENS